ELAIVGDDLLKPIERAIDDRLEIGAIAIVLGLEHRAGVLVGGAVGGDGRLFDAVALRELVDVEFGHDHADAAGERSLFGEEILGSAGDVVSAAGAEAADAGDDVLLLPEPANAIVD